MLVVVDNEIIESISSRMQALVSILLLLKLNLMTVYKYVFVVAIIVNNECCCSKQERRSTLECVKCLCAYTNNRVRH